jgi:hypothetical protein
LSTDNPEEDLGPISDEELREALENSKQSAESQDADEDTTLNQLPPGRRPEIIKEPIDDPAILNRLMGSASSSEAADASTEDVESAKDITFDQSAIDALIAGESEETRPTEPSPADEPFDQSAIDALIAGETEEAPIPEERAVVLVDGDELQAGDFALLDAATALGGDAGGIRAGLTVAQAERELIFTTLEACDNNKTQAAGMLDISVRTLRNKLREYGE